ncbi:MAG: O-acetylhomoserine aminocarboxypropyltransferase/cysteine synthase [Planctomycetota bacterium]|jgi:O-acetylhomoserine (thiol)-lyase|nr:O-acetylhomoserine aminocarboxypropyltransferase/cysteine synthase [Planctomycetota bacterium]
MTTPDPGLATRAVHAGFEADSTGARAVPIYQTTSYLFRDAEHAANLFALREFGNIYSRIMNPTNDALEKRLAGVFGGTGCLSTASGMSAIFYAITTVCSAGDNFVTGDKLYGGTYTLFGHTLKRFGIEARFVDMRDPAAVAAAIDDKTKLVYTESIGNPKCNIDDLPAIAAVAHEHGLPLVLDATVSPPPVFDPFAYGADLVVLSLTKMIGGHGNSVGGAIIEKGDFDWSASGRFGLITEDDPTYHGVNFWAAFGAHDKAVAPGLAFVLKARTGMLRDTGACLSPTNAFNLIQGLETLPLRGPKHCANAQVVAEFLAKHPKIEWVEYAGLSDHPDHARAKAMFPHGPGAIFGFGVRGGFEAGKKLIDKVQLCSHLANVLDARSLVIHPASTTHQQLTPEEQLQAGVRPEMIRVSVGIEDTADICADLDQALG